MTSWGRLPMSAVDRRAGARSLDGDWRFQLLPAPDAPVAEAWSSAYVPGVWTMQGTDDLPQYTNVRMPYTEFPPLSPAANPTGVYEREIDVPADWAGRRIVLQVGAAESVLLVHVDGRPVGVSKDSHLAADFDLTDAVRPGGRATVRLTVVKWSDASHLEDQDQWWHGGITRSVLLYTTDPLHLADVTVRASYDGALRVDCQVRDAGGALPDGWYVSGDLDGQLLTQEEEFDRFNAEDDRVSDFLGEARMRATVTEVRTWNAETPELYGLTVRLHRADGTVADASYRRIGFRDVEIVGRDLLVNGERVYIRGVNRHDFHPLTGRTVSYDDMRADLVLLKRFGFNAIRTAHYPNDPALYDLADELGLYVVDEADIESHDHAHEIADDPRYLNAFVDRVARMVLRDKNHPSVIIWSLGNESDYGANHDAAAYWVRRHDPTRPIQYEGAAKRGWADPDLASDIACPMYAPLEDCVAHALSGEQTKPLIQCEYSHAMGNSNGTLADHWAAIESTPGLQGGFIWEFWDHGILQRVSDGRPTGRAGAGLYDNGVAAPGQRWAYGGDFGEAIHDGAFIADGVVFPDRTPKPVMFEHREIAAPVRIECFRHEGIVLGNHQHFRGLDWLAGTWELALADGRTLTALAELPALCPGETVAVPLPFALPEDGGEAWLTLRVTTAEDQPWAPRGTDVCAPQVRLRAATPVAAAVVGGGRVEVDGEGLLLHPLLTVAPTLSLWRAPTDNDELGGMAARWRTWGLDSLVRKVVSVRRDGERSEMGVPRPTAGEGDDGRRVRRGHRCGPALSGVHAGGGRGPDRGIGRTARRVRRRGPGRHRVRDGAGARSAGVVRPGSLGVVPRPQHGRARGPPLGPRRRAVHPVSAAAGERWAARGTAVHTVGTGRHRSRGRPRRAPPGLGDPPSRRRPDRRTAPRRTGAARVLCGATRRGAPGLGTASCGPDTSPQYLVAPGVHRWSWTLRVL